MCDPEDLFCTLSSSVLCYGGNGACQGLGGEGLGGVEILEQCFQPFPIMANMENGTLRMAYWGKVEGI